MFYVTRRLQDSLNRNIRVIKPSLVFSNLSLGILMLVLLLLVRFAATRVSTFRSEMYKDRRGIMLMCAQGLTPATLAILAVSLQIPLADTFLNIVTYVIILTNIVTAVGSILNMRQQKQGVHNSLENTDEKLKKTQSPIV